jgi:serine/threonine protein kinase
VIHGKLLAVWQARGAAFRPANVSKHLTRHLLNSSTAYAQAQVAIKTLKERCPTVSVMANMPEVIALRALSHPNVIKCVESILDAGRVHLVFELMPDGDLESLNSAAGGKISSQHVAAIAYQILAATDYVHKSNFLHRDIKPENIFVSYPRRTINADKDSDRPWQGGAAPLVKIGDFGLAKQMAGAYSGNQHRPHTSYVATRWYRAPEQLLRMGSYGPAADMWSVGATIAEMATGGRPLFAGDDEPETLGAIFALRGEPAAVGWRDGARATAGFRTIRRRTASKEVIAALQSTSSQFYELVDSLLQLDPARRPTAAAAMRLPIFKGCSSWALAGNFRGGCSDGLRTPALSSRAGTHDGLNTNSHVLDTPSSSRHCRAPLPMLPAVDAACHELNFAGARDERRQGYMWAYEENRLSGSPRRHLREAPFHTPERRSNQPFSNCGPFVIPSDTKPDAPATTLRSPAGFFNIGAENARTQK